MSNLAYQDESTYTLQQLAADVETIVADKQEHASIVAAAEPLLERFLTTNSLPEEYCQPAPTALPRSIRNLRYTVSIVVRKTALILWQPSGLQADRAAYTTMQGNGWSKVSTAIGSILSGINAWMMEHTPATQNSRKPSR